MKRQLVFVVMVFLLKHKVTYASMWSNNGYSEFDVYLQGFTLESSRVNTIFECHRKCENNLNCASINMILADKTCELKASTKARRPGNTIHRQNTLYMELRDLLPGSNPLEPMLSCKWLKTLDSHAKSGVYWMKFNEPSSVPFQVFCDMTTDGGGWTLVYSYEIREYSSFKSWSNAITPIPTWPVDTPSGLFVPQSTTTPLNEASRSAMDYTLWQKFGNEFLVKPNISNWIACAEGTGSFVNWRTGSLTCRMVKAITPTCTTVVPDKIHVDTYCGPALFIDAKYMIHFEGRTNDCFPIHDPCGYEGGDPMRHLTNVPNPAGVVYLR